MSMLDSEVCKGVVILWILAMMCLATTSYISYDFSRSLSANNNRLLVQCM